MAIATPKFVSWPYLKELKQLTAVKKGEETLDEGGVKITRWWFRTFDISTPTWGDDPI